MKDVVINSKEWLGEVIEGGLYGGLLFNISNAVDKV